MNLTSLDTDTARIIRVDADRIDAAVAIRFKEGMRAQTDGGPDHVILDLASVTFIDSSGLGAIVAAMKQMEAHRRLDLAGLTPVVDKVFRLTRMDSVFRLFGSPEDALSAARG